ncbi:vacuolar protein sorting-associated protein 52 homolog [Rhinoraja longicauda]
MGDVLSQLYVERETYEEVADKDDLMGVEDTAKKGFFSKPSLKNRNTIFTLGNRGNVIASSELEAPIIVPHAAQKNDSRYPCFAASTTPSLTTAAASTSSSVTSSW